MPKDFKMPEHVLYFPEESEVSGRQADSDEASSPYPEVELDTTIKVPEITIETPSAAGVTLTETTVAEVQPILFYHKLDTKLMFVETESQSAWAEPNINVFRSVIQECGQEVMPVETTPESIINVPDAGWPGQLSDLNFDSPFLRKPKGCSERVALWLKAAGKSIAGKNLSNQPQTSLFCMSRSRTSNEQMAQMESSMKKKVLLEKTQGNTVAEKRMTENIISEKFSLARVPLKNLSPEILLIEKSSPVTELDVTFQNIDECKKATTSVMEMHTDVEMQTEVECSTIRDLVKHVAPRIIGGNLVEKAVFKRMAEVKDPRKISKKVKFANQPTGYDEIQSEDPAIKKDRSKENIPIIMNPTEVDNIAKLFSLSEQAMKTMLPTMEELNKGASLRTAELLTKYMDHMNEVCRRNGEMFRAMIDISEYIDDEKSKKINQLELDVNRMQAEKATMSSQQDLLVQQLHDTKEVLQHTTKGLQNTEEELNVEQDKRQHAEGTLDQTVRAHQAEIETLQECHARKLEACDEEISCLREVMGQKDEQISDSIAAYLCTAQELWSNEYMKRHPEGDASFMDILDIVRTVDAAKVMQLAEEELKKRKKADAEDVNSKLKVLEKLESDMEEFKSDMVEVKSLEVKHPQPLRSALKTPESSRRISFDTPLSFEQPLSRPKAPVVSPLLSRKRKTVEKKREAKDRHPSSCSQPYRTQKVDDNMLVCAHTLSNPEKMCRKKRRRTRGKKKVAAINSYEVKFRKGKGIVNIVDNPHLSLEDVEANETIMNVEGITESYNDDNINTDSITLEERDMGESGRENTEKDLLQAFAGVDKEDEEQISMVAEITERYTDGKGKTVSTELEESYKCISTQVINEKEPAPLPQASHMEKKSAMVHQITEKDPEPPSNLSRHDIWVIDRVRQAHVAAGRLEEQEEDAVMSFLEITITKCKETIWSDGMTYLTVRELYNVLCDNEFIGDEILTSYCNIFKTRQETQPQLYEKSIFCAANFMNMAKSSIDNILVDIQMDEIRQSFDGLKYIFVPMCNHSHWFLLVADICRSKFFHYNSMNISPDNRQYFLEAVILMQQLLGNMFGTIKNWVVEEARTTPQQNGNDCAVYVLMYMDFLQSRRILMDWSPIDSRVYRGKVAAQILLHSNSKLKDFKKVLYR